jgi:hypothetical protein
MPQLRTSHESFHKYAWFHHFRNLAQKSFREGDSVFVVASEIGTKKGRTLFRNAVNEVMSECLDCKVPRGLFIRGVSWGNVVS